MSDFWDEDGMNMAHLQEYMENSHQKMMDLCHKFRTGGCTKREVLRLFGKELSSYDRYIYMNIGHTRFTDQSWLRFEEDFELWKNGKKPDSTIGEPWIYCGGLCAPAETKKGYCADAYDPYAYEVKIQKKIEFFTLMDYYGLTKECFNPRFREDNRKFSLIEYRLKHIVVRFLREYDSKNQKI